MPPSDGSTWTDVALGTSSWTQDAGTLDELVGGITVTTPSSCTVSGVSQSTAELDLTVDVDGNTTALQLTQLDLGQTTDLSLGEFVLSKYGQNPYVLYEWASSKTHSVTVRARQATCDGTGEDMTIGSFGLDVVTIH